MGAIFNEVRATMDADELRYDVVPGATALRFGLASERARWACVAEVREKERLVLFVSVLPVTAAPARRPALAELLNRINYGLTIGNFEMDPADGEIRFRTAVELDDAALAPGLVRALMRANLSTVARHFDVLTRAAAAV
jgi:hypothetical protein